MFHKGKENSGWEPEISLENGLKETVDWMESNWNEIKEERLEYIYKE